jgi:hypothetical protein
VKLRLSIVLTLAVLVTSCSSGVTVNPEEPTTVAELDAAVQASSQALLAGAAVPIVAAYFDITDTEKIIRYDWVDYRTNGDLLAVYNYLERTYVEGLSRSGGSWMTALISDDETHPWQPDSLGTPAEAIPDIGRLEAMMTQSTADGTGVTAVRQTASDGSSRWAVTTPLESGTGSLTREWIINKDGLVQFYRISGDTGLVDGAGSVVFEYGVSNAEPTALIVPAAGTALVLDDLGIPQALRDLENPDQ